MVIDDLGVPPGAARSPVVALLHPFPFDGRYFANIAAAMRPWARVLVAHFRGFGPSREPGVASLDAHADDIVNKLDQFPIERAYFLGLSFGGYVALALARRHPTRVAGLVLASTRATADTPKLARQRAHAIELVRSRGVHALVAHQVSTWFAVAASEHAAVEAARTAATEIALGQRADSVLAGIAALRDRADERATLRTIRVPTIALSGANDRLIAPSEMEILTEIPGAELRVVEGAGHLLSLTHPAPVLTAVRDVYRRSE